MSLRTPAKAFAGLPHDKYYTPAHAVEPLVDYAATVGLFWRAQQIWECAAGAGHMARALSRHGFDVLATDLHPAPARQQLHPVAQHDFLTSSGLSGRYSIVTNPPYGQQSRLIIGFLEKAFTLMQGQQGAIAMLLPFEFDARASRNAMVGGHQMFLAKITVARRIRWVNLPQSEHAPMGHHAWYIWSSDMSVHKRAAAQPRMVAA